jgi:hypothetical protein
VNLLDARRGGYTVAAVPGRSTALPQVRLATPGDEPELMALCRALHGEIGLFSFSESKVRGVIQQYFERRGGIIGVIGPSNAIEASICLIIAEQYYTTDWHLMEMWNFVAAPYRRSRNAEALIEFAKRCSTQIGLPLIIGVMSNVRTAPKVRLYQRRLGVPSGAFFCYNAQWQNGS